MPLEFLCVLNGSVLPVVAYYAALLLFIPVNVALLPFSLCSNAPLAVLDACFDDAFNRTRRVFNGPLNILVQGHRCFSKLRAHFKRQSSLPSVSPSPHASRQGSIDK